MLTKYNNVIIEWMKGTGYKKYKVYIYFPNGSKKTVQFGDIRYEHYKDTTPLKLYTQKNHYDTERRRLYRLRHGKKNYQKKKYSPAWFSWKYLW